VLIHLTLPELMVIVASVFMAGNLTGQYLPRLIVREWRALRLLVLRARRHVR
jgi:hypothetical protein